MSVTRVAVVTGSNKGVGFGIVDTLCKNLGKDCAVYLTARSVALGEEAVKQLEAQGYHPKFHQLDICSVESINKLASYLKEKYGGLDILVNNAGIAYKNASTAPVSEQAEVTVRTNFTGTLDTCKALFPLLRPHARVVHVSSLSSMVALKNCSDELRKKFTSPMTMDELVAKMSSFVQAAKDGQVAERGWPSSNYGTSKLGVTVMGRIQQRDFDNDPREDIIVNTCCPGYVMTDMSSDKGTKTIQEGAEIPVYLALLPPNDVKNPRGEFIENMTITEWK
ncbi:carbonyl reductase [NADPH] 1-like [Lineus longissimus]|uniref:carbonyl reductase [NADPH] 1-like n=1 Tax=Lineus longissimus TaxID=88925 RepID=UPI002B4E4C72